MVMSIPFFGLAVIAFYRQMGQPTARKTAATAEWIRTSRARELTRALTAAYSEAGYRTRPHGGNAADLQLERDDRVAPPGTVTADLGRKRSVHAALRESAYAPTETCCGAPVYGRILACAAGSMPPGDWSTGEDL